MSEEKKAYLFGIDLGTTYSCISYMVDGRVVVCPSSEGQSTVPSVVRMAPEDSEPIAGKTAKDTAILYPNYTFQFVKSKIGREAEISYGDDGELKTTPVAVSAEILKKLAKDAGAMTNSEVKDVVITVPAYFGQNERDLTRQAGVDAGLNVVDIIEEPTASAFYYGIQNSGKEENICVYDLGGGTFDVTAMKISPDTLEVITTEGDHDLGGKNWDAEMIEMAKEKFIEATGYDEEFDDDVLQELQIKCEEAKIQLTAAESASFVIKVDRKNMAKIDITREEFEQRTSALLESSIELTKKVFETVSGKGLSIDKILLVGGSTFMPQVKRRVEAEFGIPVELNEPNESVSKGACIFNEWKLANIVESTNVNSEDGPVEVDFGDEKFDVIKNDDGEISIVGSSGEVISIAAGSASSTIKNIIKVSTKSFGINLLVNGSPKIKNVIKKDTKLPVDFEITPSTSVDGQVDVSLELYQSDYMEDYYEVDEDLKVGDSILTGLPEGLPKGSPLTLRITLNESGLLEITGSYNGSPLNGKLESVLSAISDKEE